MTKPPKTTKVDKKRHYGKYMTGEEKNLNLNRKIIEKSLDIEPEPDVDIDNRRYGMTWKDILAMTALAGTSGGVGMLFGSIYSALQLPAPAPPTVTPPVVTAPDVAVSVRLYIIDPDTGEKIYIPGSVIGNEEN